MRGSSLLPALALAAAAVPAPAETPPRAGLTRQQAEAAFGIDLLFPCITHAHRGVPIADLAAEYRTDLVPAEGPDATASVGREKATAVWTSRALGSHLKVLEIGPRKCVMTADQLPVEETLRTASQATQRLTPPFAVRPSKPGYNPVVYETQGVLEGQEITVRLEGAEPGLPGHASRFSLLLATVTARPAP